LTTQEDLGVKYNAFLQCPKKACTILEYTSEAATKKLGNVIVYGAKISLISIWEGWLYKLSTSYTVVLLSIIGPMLMTCLLPLSLVS
jgi:hypothetical protein